MGINKKYGGHIVGGEIARCYIFPPPQMFFILNDTIRANEAFGIPKDEVSDAQVWRTLEKAH